MVAKLKSILRQIHWSLLLKAVVLAVLWNVFSFPLFVAAAVLLYSVPLFRPLKFGFLFITLLLIAFLLPHTLLGSLIIGTLFFLLVGVKDLLLFSRFAAHEAFVFISIITLFLVFFAHTAMWHETWQFLSLIPLLGFCFFLIRGLLESFEEEVESHFLKNRPKTIAFLITFLLLECGIVLLFLPLDFVYQAALLFAFLVLLVELCSIERKGELSTGNLFLYTTFFSVFVVILLASIEWSLS